MQGKFTISILSTLVLMFTSGLYLKAYCAKKKPLQIVRIDNGPIELNANNPVVDAQYTIRVRGRLSKKLLRTLAERGGININVDLQKNHEIGVKAVPASGFIPYDFETKSFGTFTTTLYKE